MKRIILGCLLFLISQVSMAVIVINKDFELDDVSRSLSVYALERSADFSQTAVRHLFLDSKAFTQNTHSTLQLGNSKKGYWIKGKISIDGEDARNLVLRLDYSHFANAKLFIKQSKGVAGKSIQLIPGSKQLTDCVLAFGFVAPPNGAEFLLYVEPHGVSYNIYNVHTYLYDLASYDASKFSQLAFFSILFGYILAMLAYNLVLYLYVGYKPYIYYCAYLTSMFMLNYVGTGFGNIGIIPLPTSTAVLLFSVMPSIVVIALIQFGRAILELNIHLPRINLFFRNVSLLWGLCAALIAFDLFPPGSWLIYLQLCSIAILAVVAYWVHRRKQLAGALIFSISFVFILLGSLFQLSLEVVPYEKYIDSASIIALLKWSEHYIFHIFIMIEMMLLSIALAAFIRKAEQDKQLAQAEKIELLGESLALKEQYSSQLESEVKQRTGDLKQKNTELQSLQGLRDRFFSYISHEFRSPLTLALGPLSDMVEGRYGTLGKELESAVHLAERNARKILNLVNFMLNLARQKNDKMYLSIKRVDVAALIEAQLKDYALLMARKQLAVTVNNKINHDYELWFDRHYLDSIFSNLISNACKHTQQSGTIDVECRTVDDALLVSITNSGSVISEYEQARIFDHFYKDNGSEVADDNSSGIGLAMVKEFLAIHDGDISVENTEKGVCFTVNLRLGKKHLETESWLGDDFDFISPLASDAAPNKLLPQNQELGDLEDKTSILLVDDNHELLSYLSQILQEASYDVMTAKNGEEAYATCKSQLPDIVISDVVMPVLTGLELVNKIRNDDEIKHIPIVLLTSEVDKRMQIEGIEKGADDYLTKPFVPKELLVRIQRIHQQREVLKAKILEERSFDFIDSLPLDRKDIKLRAIQIIQENFSDAQFGVETLASLLHINRSTLHRQLKDRHNITANELVLDVRLTVALKLLESDVSLVDVAYLAGFNSQSYFAKKFKEKHQVTPSQWRKNK